MASDATLANEASASVMGSSWRLSMDCVPAEMSSFNRWTRCLVAALLSQSTRLPSIFEIYMHQNLPQIFAETISPTVLWLFDIFSPRSCRRWNFGSFWEHRRRNIILDFQHAGQNSMESGFRLRLTILDALHRFREVPHVALSLI